MFYCGMVVALLWIFGISMVCSLLLTCLLGYYFIRLVRKTYSYACRKIQKHDSDVDALELVTVYRSTVDSLPMPVPLS